MEIEKQLSNLVPLLLSAQQKQKISHQTYQSLNGRLSTLIYIIGDSSLESLSEIYRTILKEILNELESLLNNILNESNSFFLSKIRNWLPGSNISKLEALVPRMLDVTDKIVSSMQVQKYIEKSVNTKRKAEHDYLDESSTSEPDEVKAAAQGFKKIKGNVENVSLKATASSTAKQNQRVSQAPFTIKILCAKELDENIPLTKRVKLPNFNGLGYEGTLAIRREDFQELPKDVILRLSKDHATISMRDDSIVQIKNTSMNGVFYMGNIKDHDFGSSIPFKVEKNSHYRLIDGDVIALLMKKDSPKEMLLGFEFHEKTNNSSQNLSNNAIVPETNE